LSAKWWLPCPCSSTGNAKCKALQLYQPAPPCLLTLTLTPAMFFLLVLMSYHEKAHQDGQTACCTLKIPSFSSTDFLDKGRLSFSECQNGERKAARSV
jgi:hypothetical protein